MSALKFWVWLSELRGLSNQARLALLDHFGSPEEVYYADAGELLLSEGIDRTQVSLIEQQRNLRGADRILADCDRLGLRILTIGDGDYPGRLQNIYDPPVLLYAKGRVPVFDEELAVAMVGTRTCSPYGLDSAEKLGYGLAKGGALIISGLAKGIDAAATRGALRAGAGAVGVVGNGLDVKYPAESRFLYDDVAAVGVLLSEYPPGTAPEGRHFPARNRIMSGLSAAVLVVEAPERSGAMITANLALDQGRDLYAVPGPINALGSVGCNRLIREGAGLVAEPSDLLDDYQQRFPNRLRTHEAQKCEESIGDVPPVQETPAEPLPPSFSLEKNERGLTDDQLTVLRNLTAEPIQVDDLIEKCGLPTRRVLSALTILEIEELVTQQSGKYYTLAVTLIQ